MIKSPIPPGVWTSGCLEPSQATIIFINSLATLGLLSSTHSAYSAGPHIPKST